MTPAEAYHVLQLEPGAGREQIAQSYAEQTRVFKEKRAKAPSPGHKAHFQQGLARLTAAHDVLIQREDAAADAARRRRGANTGAAAGQAEVEARGVTAAEVDAMADRLPRRLNRHADGAFFALLATLAGGLVGAGIYLLVAEDSGRRAVFVGGGLGVGLVPGIVWWRATVQRLRRVEWIQVREALERGETLPLAWRRQALRLASALLLLLGFGVSYRQWTRWPTARPEERDLVLTVGAGAPLSARVEAGAAVPSKNEATKPSAAERSRRDVPQPREQTLPEEPWVNRDRTREAGPAAAVRPNADAPTVIRPEDRAPPPIAAASRQATTPAGRPMQPAASASLSSDDASAHVPTGVTAASNPAADGLVTPNAADFVGESSAAEPRDTRAARAAASSRNQAGAAPGRARRATQASTVPADVVRAEAARTSGGDPAAVRAGLATAYRTWAEGLREAGKPGLALFALDQAKAAGLADDAALAALLRKEFSEANGLTVTLTPPQVIEPTSDGAPSGAALQAVATELDHTLRETLSAALPEVVTLKPADAKSAETNPRGPQLVLRIEARASETSPPASTEAPRESTAGDTSAPAEPLPRTLGASVVWRSRAGADEEEEVVLLRLTAELRADPDARATSRAAEAEALAALGSELEERLRRGMPELRATFAGAALAALQTRRAAAAGEFEEAPGDLEWGWFAVWAEAGLVLPQGDAEQAARRALALPEAKPVGESNAGSDLAGVADPGIR